MATNILYRKTKNTLRASRELVTTAGVNTMCSQGYFRKTSLKLPMLCFLSVITLFRHFTLSYSLYTTCTLLPRLSHCLFLIERLLSLSLSSRAFDPERQYSWYNKQTDLVLVSVFIIIIIIFSPIKVLLVTLMWVSGG